MSKKVVTITFVVDNNMTADRLEYCLSKYGYITYKDEVDMGYQDYFQDLGYGEAGIIVSETLISD